MSAYAQEARNHCDVVCEYLPSIVTRYLIQGVNEEVKLPTEAENGIFFFFSLREETRRSRQLARRHENSSNEDKRAYDDHGT